MWLALAIAIAVTVLVCLVFFLCAECERRRNRCFEQLQNPEFWDCRLTELHHELADLAAIVRRELDHCGIVYWLHCGSLMGAVLNRGFIPYDDDIDIALDGDGCDFDIRFARFERRMAKYADVTDLVLWWPDTYHVRFRGCKERRFIDLFVHRERNDGTLRSNFLVRMAAPNEYYYFDEIFPLRSLAFCGRAWPVPNKARNFLRRAYPGYEREGRLQWPHSFAMDPLGMIPLWAWGIGEIKMPRTREETENLKEAFSYDRLYDTSSNDDSDEQPRRRGRGRGRSLRGPSDADS